MIVLYKKENLLYAKVLMDLRLPIPYQTKLFAKGKREMLLLPDEVMHVLTHNGNMRIWNGAKFIKMNLGQFYDVINNKQYKVENVPEPKKEEPKIVEQPKEEKPIVKEEPKQVQPKVVERPKEEKPKVVEQPKEEKPKQSDYNNSNKKQRHNNKQQNNQGGDK